LHGRKQTNVYKRKFNNVNGQITSASFVACLPSLELPVTAATPALLIAKAKNIPK
jgi:hypothetical protein